MKRTPACVARPAELKNPPPLDNHLINSCCLGAAGNPMWR
jgi:hypothetical protein